MSDISAPQSDSDALNAAEGLDPVDPAYAHVLRATTAFNLLPVAIGVSVADYLLMPRIGGPYGLLTAAVWLVAIIAIVTFPALRVTRWGYRMGEGHRSARN
jgi:hypothetical protein